MLVPVNCSSVAAIYSSRSTPDGVSAIGVHVCNGLSCPRMTIHWGTTDCSKIENASVRYGVCICDTGYIMKNGKCVIDTELDVDLTAGDRAFYVDMLQVSDELSDLSEYDSIYSELDDISKRILDKLAEIKVYSDKIAALKQSYLKNSSEHYEETVAELERVQAELDASGLVEELAKEFFGVRTAFAASTPDLSDLVKKAKRLIEKDGCAKIGGTYAGLACCLNGYKLMAAKDYFTGNISSSAEYAPQTCGCPDRGVLAGGVCCDATTKFAYNENAREYKDYNRACGCPASSNGSYGVLKNNECCDATTNLAYNESTGEYENYRASTCGCPYENQQAVSYMNGNCCDTRTKRVFNATSKTYETLSNSCCDNGKAFSLSASDITAEGFCCASDEKGYTYNNTEHICCANDETAFKYTQSSGAEVAICCASGTTLRTYTYNGEVHGGCCPENNRYLIFQPENNITKCCSNETDMLLSDSNGNDAQICCPIDKVYKDTYVNKEKCCSSGEIITKGDGTQECCPNGQIAAYRGSDSATDGLNLPEQVCCDESNLTRLNLTGREIKMCCSPGKEYQTTTVDGKNIGMCCEKQKTLKSLFLNGNYKSACCLSSNHVSVLNAEDDMPYCCPSGTEKTTNTEDGTCCPDDSVVTDDSDSSFCCPVDIEFEKRGKATNNECCSHNWMYDKGIGRYAQVSPICGCPVLLSEQGKPSKSRQSCCGEGSSRKFHLDEIASLVVNGSYSVVDIDECGCPDGGVDLENNGTCCRDGKTWNGNDYVEDKTSVCYDLQCPDVSDKEVCREADITYDEKGCPQNTKKACPGDLCVDYSGTPTCVECIDDVNCTFDAARPHCSPDFECVAAVDCSETNPISKCNPDDDYVDENDCKKHTKLNCLEPGKTLCLDSGNKDTDDSCVQCKSDSDCTSAEPICSNNVCSCPSDTHALYSGVCCAKDDKECICAADGEHPDCRPECFGDECCAGKTKPDACYDTCQLKSGSTTEYEWVNNHGNNYKPCEDGTCISKISCCMDARESDLYQCSDGEWKLPDNIRDCGNGKWTYSAGGCCPGETGTCGAVPRVYCGWLGPRTCSCDDSHCYFDECIGVPCAEEE